MAKTRTCACCGKTYSYCPTCGKDTTKPWLAICDTEECREVLNIISAYNMGIVDKDRVKTVLDKYNVNDFSKYKKSISDKLNELFPPITEISEKPYKKKWKKNNEELGYEEEKISNEEELVE